MYAHFEASTLELRKKIYAAFYFTLPDYYPSIRWDKAFLPKLRVTL